LIFENVCTIIFHIKNVQCGFFGLRKKRSSRNIAIDEWPSFANLQVARTLVSAVFCRDALKKEREMTQRKMCS